MSSSTQRRCVGGGGLCGWLLQFVGGQQGFVFSQVAASCLMLTPTYATRTVLPLPVCVCAQTMGPRFHVLLSSYETVLKDKSELKKLQFEVGGLA